MILRTTRRRRRRGISGARVLGYVVVALALVAFVSWNGDADWARLLRRSDRVSEVLVPIEPAAVGGDVCDRKGDEPTVPACAYLEDEQRIAAANRAQPGATWAGRYVAAGEDTVLEIDVGANGIATRQFRAIAYRRSTRGGFERNGDRLAINYVSMLPGEGLRLLWSPSWLVRWGPRRYLIEEADMDAFVNAVNRGEVATDAGRASSFYPLHEGDDAVAACGRPLLPPPWNERLRETPIAAGIDAVAAFTPAWPSPYALQRDLPLAPPPPQPLHRARLAAGAAEGVFPQQEFHWDGDSDERQLRAKVERVEPHAAMVVIESTAWCAERVCAAPLPRPGMRFVSAAHPVAFPPCAGMPAP